MTIEKKGETYIYIVIGGKIRVYRIYVCVCDMNADRVGDLLLLFVFWNIGVLIDWHYKCVCVCQSGVRRRKAFLTQKTKSYTCLEWNIDRKWDEKKRIIFLLLFAPFVVVISHKGLSIWKGSTTPLFLKRLSK